MRIEHSSSRLRRGVTLLELLVVMLIMLTISAIAIPVLVPAFSGRELREGARSAHLYLGGAQERAMAQRRPFGVRLERDPGQPDACLTMMYVEQPTPLSGDATNSLAVTDVIAFVSGGSTVYINRVRAGQLAIIPGSPPSSSFSYDMWSDPTLLDMTNLANNVVHPLGGDFVQFEYQGHRYELLFHTQANCWYIGLGTDNNADGIPDVWAMNSNSSSLPYITQEFSDLNGNFLHDGGEPSVDWNGNNSPVADNDPVPYQVFRQPTQARGDPIVMPEAVAIDLNFSGDDFVPFHPRFNDPDYGNADPHIGVEVIPQDRRGPMIIFAEDGSLKELWGWRPDGAGGWQYRAFRPLSPVYLLVGVRELIRPDLYNSGDPTAGAINYTWQDLDSIWISVNQLTGLITTAANAGAPPLPAPANPGAEPTPVLTRLFVARELARATKGLEGN